MNKTCGLLAAVLALGPPLAFGQEKPIAFVGARIIPIAGPEIASGVLVVHRARSWPWGRRARPSSRGGLRVDVTGKVIMPGLVDTHSHIGSVEGADASAPIQPDVRVLDAINVRDARHPARRRPAASPRSTSCPAPATCSRGQTIYLKLRDGPHDRGARSSATPTARSLGGMKMANGTNSRREPPFPGTRAKSAALVREQYVKAQEYRQQDRATPATTPNKRPARDLGAGGAGRGARRQAHRAPPHAPRTTTS